MARSNKQNHADSRYNGKLSMLATIVTLILFLVFFIGCDSLVCGEDPELARACDEEWSQCYDAGGEYSWCGCSGAAASCVSSSGTIIQIDGEEWLWACASAQSSNPCYAGMGWYNPWYTTLLKEDFP